MGDAAPRAACWLTPDQAPAVSRVLAAAGIVPALAGSPEPSQSSQSARAIGAEPADDLRGVLTGGAVDLVLIAAPGVFGHIDIDQDLTALQLARQRAVPVATTEPVPAQAMELAGSNWVEALENGSLGELIRFVPRTRRTRAIDELHAALETFGVARTGSLRMHGPSTLATLGARLFDAMDLTRTLMGVPETVDACVVTPANGRGLHILPGESLRGLSGDLTAHLRFADGRSLALHLSDQVPRSGMDLRLFGPEGTITLTPDRLVWLHTDGEPDETVIATTGDEPGESALVTQLANLCAGVGPSHAPIDYPAVLAMTHAALLSCRTGQGESPETIRRLMRSA